jgi:hypothetical protein
VPVQVLTNLEEVQARFDSWDTDASGTLTVSEWADGLTGEGAASEIFAVHLDEGTQLHASTCTAATMFNALLGVYDRCPERLAGRVLKFHVPNPKFHRHYLI